MTVEEMDNMFEVLYNNITSTQAPGLNAFEKSVFLTKAQNEIVKNHFSAKSKGNALQEGFDDSQKRQIDFSMLTTIYTKTSGFGDPKFDLRGNTKSIELPSNLMIAINEMVEVSRNSKTNILQVIPIKFDEYTRLMSKPFKRPLKYQAWRLLSSDTKNIADIVVGPVDELTKYIIRYIKKPTPIIVSPLDDVTIDGYSGANTSGEPVSSGAVKGLECELDEIIHDEIVQRAVELAKIAWLATDANGSQLEMTAGVRSE